MWIVASRPEPHITSFFGDASVATACTKEELMIDSNEACEDVRRYLCDELNKIKLAYPSILKCKREWPSELEFKKIATAAGGLFAYASTVVQYIGDPHYRDPATQLRFVLDAIHGGPKGDVSGKDHPMALLDALYQRILANISADVMTNARKLLLMYSDNRWCSINFRMMCNILGLSEAAAYGAICQLHAILKVPAPDDAGTDCLAYLHKSFPNFLCDFKRSNFSSNMQDEAGRLWAQCSFRIVEDVFEDWDSIDGGEGIECDQVGYLKGGLGFCDTISLSWPGDERYQITDDQLRLKLYCGSMASVCNGFGFDNKFYWSISCFHILTTRFTALGVLSPISKLRNSVFDHFRLELMELGKLKQVPLSMFDYAAVCGWIELRFMSPIGMGAQSFDTWNTSCEHFKRIDEHGDGLPQWRGWKTSFGRSIAGDKEDVTHTDNPKFNRKVGKDSHWEVEGFEEGLECLYCSRRFARHFIDNSHELVTVFVDSTGLCYVELLFVDLDDGVSEWRYRFFHSGRPSYVN
ncbi:hypothetical protein Agabi119p4_5630 [Agaricus bisporus var. burnettii]|uniref:Uncharacterized protein n=1 Tax=Agaricus bisporus var. burnettii TaxID=192524 RepID=A0A8H7F209_AGABI|nr:hypothetical protein Agabi119p4_5630 [Agaricus bisporus var. burnettii]